MILMYAFAAWLGGAVTVAFLWESAGPLLAIALAPFGGSALVLCAALWTFIQQAPGRADRVHSIGVGRHWWRLVR